jgi:hypothetical protein
MPAAPFEVDIFGGVGQQREPVEGAKYEHLLIERMLGEGGSYPVDRAVARAATIDCELADLFDQVEGGLAVGGSDRVAEEAPEEADVVADCVVGHRHSQAR